MWRRRRVPRGYDDVTRLPGDKGWQQVLWLQYSGPGGPESAHYVKLWQKRYGSGAIIAYYRRCARAAVKSRRKIHLEKNGAHRSVGNCGGNDVSGSTGDSSGQCWVFAGRVLKESQVLEQLDVGDEIEAIAQFTIKTASV